MAEKTEKATPKKLQDARKKGQVAKAQDAPAAATFIVSLSMTFIIAGYLYQKISAFILAIFSQVDNPEIGQLIPSLFLEGARVIFFTAIPILLATACTGILVNFLLIGPLLTFEPFKPDIKKFNPIDNIKNKFKIKTLVEVIKQLFKLFGAAYLIYGVMRDSIPIVISTIDMPIALVSGIYTDFFLNVIFRVGLFFGVIAILDLSYQRYNFANEMKMEKHEVKQEYKNTEGDPQIKSKRRQLGQEIVYSDAPHQAAKQAKAVITNPTHIAIAIGFDPKKYAVPYILAMGKNIQAESILEVAEDYEVPVVRNIYLARLLYAEGSTWDYIPESSYEAVAEILRWLSQLEQEKQIQEEGI